MVQATIDRNMAGSTDMNLNHLDGENSATGDTILKIIEISAARIKLTLQNYYSRNIFLVFYTSTGSSIFHRTKQVARLNVRILKTWNIIFKKVPDLIK